MDSVKREVKIDKFDYLRNIPIFERLEEHELDEISKIIKTRKYEKDSIIISEENQAVETYIVKSGKVKIYKTDLDGREFILDIKGEGKPFAEVMLFNSGKYPATVKTIEDSELYIIDNKELEELLERCPKMALDILKIMSKRLQIAQKKLRDFALDDVYIRTARELLNLSDKYGKKSKNTIEIELTLSREEFAKLIGTSRETVSRALSKFSKEGSIVVKGKNIKIIDIEKLRGWLN